ncbi:hypothetical protein HMPREF3038_02254 [Akkermansia sp. KLE1797]|nr:hypothetical protein HMPREF3038_02254 [Akkermansia sp. KLE1797]KXU53216.1 hypothetical protein HMPREF3039_02626 [Akkermansia sp. KLE1798]KZA05343.1 hypothetical protein HMPREF1326_00957 [Akkermansia sp. KLE1605]
MHGIRCHGRKKDGWFYSGPAVRAAPVILINSAPEREVNGKMEGAARRFCLLFP